MANSDYIELKCRNILKMLLDSDLTGWIEHYSHFKNHENTIKCNKLNNYINKFVENIKESLKDSDEKIITGPILREYLSIIYYMYLKDLHETHEKAYQIKKMYDENCDLNIIEPICINDVIKYPLVYALLCMLYIPKSTNQHIKKHVEDLKKKNNIQHKVFFCNYVCKKECYPNMTFFTLDREEIEKIINEI